MAAKDRLYQNMLEYTIYLMYKTFGIIFFPAQLTTDIMAVPQKYCE